MPASDDKHGPLSAPQPGPVPAPGAPPEPATAAPAAATVFGLPERFGRYRILKRIGQGGMGVVYLAHDTQLDRTVALKVPTFLPDEGPDVRQRFFHEARAAATITHQNICPVYDVGEIDGIPYLTMAYIEGQQLAALINPDQPLSPRRAGFIVRKLAFALQEAHARGVIHRDLKPTNVMINRHGEPILMDFGLARRGADEIRLAGKYDFIGTPAYMAPERLMGDAPELGPRTDVYSLGVLLYEMTTTRLPHEGPTAAVFGQILMKEPPPPSTYRPGLDAAFEAVCLKAMAKRVEDRYASMADLGAALTSYLRSSIAPPPAARPAAPATETARVTPTPGEFVETPRLTPAPALPAAPPTEPPAESAASLPPPPEARPSRPSAWKLFVLSGPDKGKVFSIPAEENILLGRGKADVRLRDKNISRVHCQVEWVGDGLQVADFQSTAGTYVNGKQVSIQPLRPNDVLQLGHTRLLVVHGELPKMRKRSKPPTPRPGPQAETFAAVDEEPTAPAPPVRPSPTPESDDEPLALDPVSAAPWSRDTSAARRRLAELEGKQLSQFAVGPVLAEGCSGLVFHARDVKNDRPAVLKVLWPDDRLSETDKQRYAQAMRTALPLRHPNLVALYGAGKSGAYRWIAAEHVEGDSLRHVLQHERAEGTFDWRIAFRIAMQIGQGLEFASRNYIVHGNITPTNILIRCRDRLAKLNDLILRQALAGSALEERMTAAVLPYRAPELTYGEDVADARSDIYGLGATLYALLAGVPPFRAESLSLLRQKVRRMDPVRPTRHEPGVPAPLEALVMRMIAKRPEDRFQTAAELLEELDRVAYVLGI